MIVLTTLRNVDVVRTVQLTFTINMTMKLPIITITGVITHTIGRIVC